MAANTIRLLSFSIAALVIICFGCKWPTDKPGAVERDPQQDSLTFKNNWKISAPGLIEPLDGVKQLAPSIGPGGVLPVIEKLMVEEGDIVSQNQLLAVLDSNMEVVKELKMETQRAKSYQKELQTLQLQTQRYAGLQDAGALPSAEYEDRLLKLQRLETEVKSTYAKVEILKQRLKKTYILAPHDGIVLEIYARQGEQASSEGVLSLVNTKKVGVLAQIEEKYADSIRIGDPVFITSENGFFPQQMRGRVAYIANHVSRRRSFFTKPGGAKDSEPRVVNIKLSLINRSGVDIGRMTGAKVMVHFHKT